MKKQRTHKRKLLFRFLLSLILLTTAAIVVLIVFWEKEWQSDIARQYIERSTEKAIHALNTVQKPIERSLIIGRKWGETGLFNMQDPASIYLRFLPVLEELPQSAGMILVNTADEEYFLMPDSGFWLVRYWKTGYPRNKVTWLKLDSARHILRTWQEKRKFLPSSRPWFSRTLQAIDSTSGLWYGPYLFASKQKIGLTRSIAWEDKKSAQKYILAFDILLDKLMKEISSAKMTAHTVNFLFTKEGFVLLSPDSAGEKALRALRLEECSNPIIRHAVQKWLQDSSVSVQPVKFTLNNDVYWAGFRSISKPANKTYIASILPQNDFQSDVDNRFLRVALFVLLVILISSLVGYGLLVKLGHSKDKSVSWKIDNDNPQQSIREKIKQGEGRFVEFKSTMRMNLKAGKPGKEIELAWLKTVAAFLNSEGGILFIGVDDDGNIFGLDADGFENEDRCRLHFKNVFNQHIGMEFSSFVDMEIYSIDGKDIACVQCKPSSDPVFVKTRNDEEIFYIRSGPSTVKLPPSKIIEYIKQRKK